MFLEVNHICREIWVYPLNEDYASKGKFSTVIRGTLEIGSFSTIECLYISLMKY